LHVWNVDAFCVSVTSGEIAVERLVGDYATEFGPEFGGRIQQRAAAVMRRSSQHGVAVGLEFG